VSGRIPQYFIDQLIARTDIVDVIGTRVPLRKAGKEYKACCPFHNEKTPSFNVVPDKQFYHCFGCGVHGTALGFLMDYDHLTFVEAVEELATRAGLEVPYEKSSVPVAAKPAQDQYQLMESAAEFFRKRLRSSPEAIEYLKKRGLTGETAARFGIGYAAESWDELLNHLSRDDASRQALFRCGLIIERDNKSGYYDRFRQRVMFPIRDSRGRTIGFGGRIIGAGEPKYLNSPETELFHKGRELYGLYEARQSTRQLTRLMVVEGYMDVVSLHQAGVTYAVATLGTATTPDHLQRLFRIVNEIVFCFDGDRAGRAAAWRALENSLPQAREGRSLRFMFLPEGHDPDTLVQAEGKEAFETRVAQALPLSEYLAQELSARHDLSQVEGRDQFIKQAQELLNKLVDASYRELLFERLAQALNISTDRLQRVMPLASLDEVADSGATVIASSGRGSLVRQAIQNLLHFPQAANKLSSAQLDELAQMDKPGVALLVQLASELKEHPELNPAALLERWRDRPDFNYIDKLFVKGPLATSAEVAGTEVVDAVQRLLAEQFPQARFDDLMRRFNLGALTTQERQELRELTQKNRSARP
jgi:DNA primase